MYHKTNEKNTTYNSNNNTEPPPPTIFFTGLHCITVYIMFDIQ